MTPITDNEAISALQELAECEGVTRGLWRALTLSPTRSAQQRIMSKEQTIVVNLSGRGDKDMPSVAEFLGVEL